MEEGEKQANPSTDGGPPRGWKRPLLLRVAAMSLGLLMTLFLLEVVLRFLPVNDGLHTLPVNDANPVVRFAPNRDAIWSGG